jgi:hypothetical protein
MLYMRYGGLPVGEGRVSPHDWMGPTPQHHKTQTETLDLYNYKSLPRYPIFIPLFTRF